MALLAFISNLVDKDTKMIGDLGCSLLYFAIGTLLVVIASGFVYIVQVLYQNNQSINRGKKLNIFVVIIIFISYLSFFMGINSTYKTFATVFQ